ncbi:hypothetical protein BC628DRAFT_798010 [Trametes gibbosa]|nr:hypothetical protein BC628DRAFT_798010 [Trametes gibbosa]
MSNLVEGSDDDTHHLERQITLDKIVFTTSSSRRGLLVSVLSTPQSGLGAATSTCGAGAAEDAPMSATATARTISLKLNMLAGKCGGECEGERRQRASRCSSTAIAQPMVYMYLRPEWPCGAALELGSLAPRAPLRGLLASMHIAECARAPTSFRGDRSQMAVGSPYESGTRRPCSDEPGRTHLTNRFSFDMPDHSIGG